MKKAIKLTQQQLRSIIKEVTDSRDLSGNFSLVEAVTEAFRSALDEAWPFEAGDPSMAAEGEEAWANQKDAAVMQFQNDVSDVIDHVVSKLVDGEYHEGGGGGFDIGNMEDLDRERDDDMTRHER